MTPEAIKGTGVTDSFECTTKMASTTQQEAI